MIGGVLATAGGLVFTGEGTGCFRAYRRATATRADVQRRRRRQRAALLLYGSGAVQYVVVAAGGNVQLDYKSGNAIGFYTAGDFRPPASIVEDGTAGSRLFWSVHVSALVVALTAIAVTFAARAQTVEAQLRAALGENGVPQQKTTGRSGASTRAIPIPSCATTRAGRATTRSCRRWRRR